MSRGNRVTPPGNPVNRLRITIRGAVQGVGFRPFIYRLATGLSLNGFVTNSTQGVSIEVEGPAAVLEVFLLRIETEKPPPSFIQSLEYCWLDPVGLQGFEIRPSNDSGPRSALILPDIATCPECLREILDPANRRFFHPFTNCTHCGPRFTIIESLPYDRPNTAMKHFLMCPECRREYEDPANRRFHAQPNACPECGPRLALWDHAGRVVLDQQTGSRTILENVADALRAGQIVAAKGIGGFHLLADARREDVVQRLRERKHREEKPFAVMFPSFDAIADVCKVSPLEERLLRSPEAPIVLMRRHRQPRAGGAPIASSVAPGNPFLGVMLPYSPLHHLLLKLMGSPLVATSGNLSDEPICIDEGDAVQRLGGIADLFLVHNRPILRHADDSVARILLGREQVLRRARGYAPLPITLPGVGPRILAVGAHLKNAVALASGHNVFISQHIGDLDTAEAFSAFERVIADFQNLYQAQPESQSEISKVGRSSRRKEAQIFHSRGAQDPGNWSLLTSAATSETGSEIIACDAHPDYASTRYAIGRASHCRRVEVQHHLAHVLSCMAENEIEPPVLGVAWDGTGYGLDGSIWGGEFFCIEKESWRRVAHFRSFPLPGGDAAIKQPRRTALGLLHELEGDRAFENHDLKTVAAFNPDELAALKTMLKQGINSPRTTSVGRLFDAVASLTGLRQMIRHEGQAAMELEFALADTPPGSAAYVFGFSNANVSEPIIIDWAPVIREVIADARRGLSVGEISFKFHQALVGAVLEVARRVSVNHVALSGGCFQNAWLTARLVRTLAAAGFAAYWHQRVPPNDGGICLGQVAAARAPLREGGRREVDAA